MLSSMSHHHFMLVSIFHHLLQPRCSLTRVPPVHPGCFVKDLALWCCCPCCALVQETRTLALNNVRGGEWHGPTRFVVPMAAPVEVTKA